MNKLPKVGDVVYQTTPREAIVVGVETDPNDRWPVTVRFTDDPKREFWCVRPESLKRRLPKWMRPQR